MTSFIRIVAAGLCAALAACDQAASVTTGIHATMAAANGKTASNTEGPATDGAQVFYTREDKRVDLQQGLIVLSTVALAECGGVASAARRLGRSVLGTAHAHGGLEPAPAGVIDVARDDGTQWELGAVGAMPGRYCGAELELRALPAGSNGAGSLVFVAPCWYPDSGLARSQPGLPFYPDELNHTCYEIPVPGGVQVLKVEFPGGPVELGQAKRLLHASARIEYDTWFDGVDVAALGCHLTCEEAGCTPCTSQQAAEKPVAQEALIGNVRNSIRIVAEGP
jgi:hypothetical protein